MPSSYTSSARFTLQATGENNNTWGAILNAGVFQLVDDNINGRLVFSLSGAKVLTTDLGATDEGRMAFLDVGGGSGGVITVPAVPQGRWVRNAAGGDVVVSGGAAQVATFKPLDSGPTFADGANVYPIMLGGKDLRTYVGDADQAIIDYVNAAISAGNQLLPPSAGNLGKALIVRNTVGPPVVEAWVPDTIKQSDVVGLTGALATITTAVGASDYVRARAFYGDLF